MYVCVSNKHFILKGLNSTRLNVSMAIAPPRLTYFVSSYFSNNGFWLAPFVAFKKASIFKFSIIFFSLLSTDATNT